MDNPEKEKLYSGSIDKFDKKTGSLWTEEEIAGFYSDDIDLPITEMRGWFVFCEDNKLKRCQITIKKA